MNEQTLKEIELLCDDYVAGGTVLKLVKEIRRLQAENAALKAALDDTAKTLGGKYNDMLDRTLKAEAELVSVKNRQHVRSPFEWMRSWLHAYADSHDETYASYDAILSWIERQPMSCE